ncbi:MAG: anti-sigma F factor [Lachnospiraceae bacterium]|nr:anti-sigma F factor [Lachnospiraceae bacterium]MBQ8598468.1 anti-sigma F factor [Lachnospiraceae bacterium]
MSRKIKKSHGFDNEMHVSFDAISVNEAFARIVVAAFVSPLNPTLEEISDIKTAVSEAVTNAIIHGYDGVDTEEKKQVHMNCMILEDVLQVVVRDEGIGIENIEQAMQPLFTTKPELDRSGMGFAFMEAFMDDLEVESVPGSGTTVTMKKKLGTSSWLKYED